MNALETNDLSKTYGTKTVVDNLCLKVAQGEIYGFLGLNGAGKTTAMRMILGMIKPTTGSAQLFGKNIAHSNWGRVGYMIETTRAYSELSVLENLSVFFRYYGLKDKQSITRIMALLNIERYKNTKAANLSLGNLQRLGLAKALIHQPDLLILDEPVNGLDPAGIVEVRLLLEKLSANGVAVLISSHLLSEISKIADKIGIIHEGRLIREVESRNLHKELHKALIICTNDNVRAVFMLKQEGIEAVITKQSEVEILDQRILEKPELISTLLVKQGLPPKKLFLYEEDLESYFLRVLSN